MSLAWKIGLAEHPAAPSIAFDAPSLLVDRTRSEGLS
jgi:hypothetical protein